MENAIAWQLDHNRKANEHNDMVLATIPADPERGSYDWWAKIARQNTGQALCDSGAIYGYTYEQPVPAEERMVTIDFHRGDFDGATINTIAWLTERLDASDPVAEALETLLYWLGSLYPRDPWATVIHNANKDLLDLADVADQGKLAIFRYFVRPRLKDLPRSYSGHYTPTGQTPDRWGDFALELMQNYPTDAIETITRVYGCALDTIHITGGENTYNYDSDLSQVIQWWGFEIENMSDAPYFAYVIVQTHNGCDVRGGYSDPVVAAVQEEMDLHTHTVELYCRECDNQWDSTYDYAKELDNLDLDKPHADPAPDLDETFSSMPAGSVTLYCPNCDTYTVNAWVF